MQVSTVVSVESNRRRNEMFVLYFVGKVSSNVFKSLLFYLFAFYVFSTFGIPMGIMVMILNIDDRLH